MSTQVYEKDDTRSAIIEKTIAFIKNIFEQNPDLESIFVPTVNSDLEVMFSIENGRITGYWNSNDGAVEDYDEIRSFLEIYQIHQNQNVADIVAGGF